MRLSRFRQWLSERRSAVLGTVSGATIVALVATAAIVAQGYTAQRFQLGDGAVWVVNGQERAVGRASTEVLALDTVVAASGEDLGVIQRGGTVLLLDRTESKLDVIDPAAAGIADSVPLPPLQPQVALAGEQAVIFEAGTGELWVTGAAQLGGFDAQATPDLSLGAGTVLSVAPDGRAFAFSPGAGLLQSIDAVSGTVTGSRELVLDGTGAVSISSVAGRWAVLDAAARELHLESGTVSLAALGGGGLVLQEPAPRGDRMLVASSAGLLAVPLDGGEPQLLTEASGSPARPLVLEGCAFAAWTGGAFWRQCAEEGDGIRGQLQSVNGIAQLSFLVNGDRAVLNDARSGRSWAVQSAGELIDNWDQLIPRQLDEPQEQPADDDSPPVIEAVQRPPVAIDDEFGARPGTATILPVLLNDYDPNGDVLVVESVTAIPEELGRVDLVSQRQQLKLTLTAIAAGTFSFDYTISDGRGATATATVTVTVRDEEANAPPQQVRSTRLEVATGDRAQLSVLGDWVDPDGDAFYLVSAAVAAPDSVSYKPDGTIVYADAGAGGELKTISLVVSDGRAESTGTVSVTVRPRGAVPIIADPFVLLAYAGEEITVEPLAHVRGGTGTIRLNSVPAKPEVTITPSYETGTFRFHSEQVRSHYLEYVVTDGAESATGLVRVDVVAPPNANATPITTPKTVFVQTLRAERVDVAGSDIDPAGGVLLVTGVMNLPPGSGVRAEVIEQRVVRVSLDAPLDAPVTFDYRVSNGLAEAVGTITVIEIPAPARVQAPIAVDDAITVRVGDAIDIPVLRNDEHPDGLPLTLDPVLDRALPDGAGLLFASGSLLRYLAPDRPGDYVANYRVSGPDGQSATAALRIAVRELDAGTNAPPVPATVTARVLAGETVRVTVPLTGIDPDGDSVQLIGQSSNPEKGAVLGVEADAIVYQAGEYSAGTDTFSYQVVDALGARATGTVRVGISPRLDGARNPVATLDEVRVRPGVTVSVEVLANDSDPDGSPLRVVSAEPNDEVTTAQIEGELVRVTPPAEPGEYGVIYGIANDLGGTSQNFIRVIVDPDAPRAHPVARDSVLRLSDIQDRDTVTVDVLANVFFADGDPRSLGLAVHEDFDEHAQVTPERLIEVEVLDRRQIIPFRVTHPEDPGVFGYAFIRVPGHDDALPQIDRRAPALTVHSESELVIELNTHVVAVSGRVQLTDSATVRATHADGSSLVRDADTLVFRSADKYFGPASISFEVTDGQPGDPDARTAVLVLPITVLPRDNQPPVFNGAVLELEPGQEKVIDLLLLTDYPYPDDIDELSYSLLEEVPAGFEARLDGTTLVVRAAAGTPFGTVRSLALGVRDELSEGRAGRIQLGVVPSTRPLLQPAPDEAIAQRGQQTTVDVLANDRATNPFPGEPLQVVALRGLDGAALPPGVQLVPSADRSTITAIIAANASPVDVNVQYQVADATGDPARYAWGNLRVSVQDRPDPITGLAPTAYADRVVTMRWNAGAANNSPITHYRVSTATLSGEPLQSLQCSGTTCDVPTPGNGSANAIRVTVVAVNAIGESDPVTFGSGVWSDLVPPAPTVLSAAPLDHGLRISWNAVASPPGASAVKLYRVTVGALTVDVSPGVCSAGTCTTDVVSASLSNGVGVEYRVSPRNDAFAPLSVWNTSQPQVGVPAGPPLVLAPPVAVAVSDAELHADWAGAFDANGRPITEYRAVLYTGAAPSCAAPEPAGATVISTAGTSASFGGLAPNTTYSLLVLATNLQGCTAGSSVVARTPPGVITALTAAGPVANGAVWDYQLTGGAIGGEPLGPDYTIYYRINGGAEYGPVPVGALLTADGAQYGQPLSVTARACLAHESGLACQAQWSAPFGFGTPVDPRIGQLTFTPDGGLLDSSGTFSWLVWPAGAYEDVQFACGTSPGAGSFTSADTSAPGSCHATAGLLQQAWLTIRVIANGGQSYDISYNGSDYD